MYLDYSKLKFDKYGQPETPELILQTLSGETITALSGVHDLKVNIKFSEPSEMSFVLPSSIDGMPTPHYEDVTGRKLIYTKDYGIYVTMNPTTASDGTSETKTVKAYSLEKRLDDKKFFLEEGTFNFYHPTSTEDTVVGRILEVARGWRVGYVSPALIGRYRTFEQYDDYLLSFIYNTAPTKFRCVFVFDPYQKTINAYDADEQRPMLPIYLDFNNLLKRVEVEEISDELVTALRPYGADELDIRNVNPIGTNWIYDLSYFISNGDISSDLAAKWQGWQRSVLNNQEYYKGLVSMRASGNAQLLVANAELTDLNGELETLLAQQSVTIQALALEETDSGRAAQQALLDEINRKISAKQDEILAKETEIDELDEQINGDNDTSYSSRIQAVVDELSIGNYFSEEEYNNLQEYFIEQDVTEDTFVATDIDTSVSGSSYVLDDAKVSVVDSTVTKIDLTSDFGKQMYVLTGGSFAVDGTFSVSCDVIRGTLEVNDDRSYVMSLYAGTIRVGEKTAASGTITISGTMQNFTSDIDVKTVDGITSEVGTALSFDGLSGTMYLTANISEYQKYSVQMELFDYAISLLSELATPTYEFSVDSGNFLFAEEFSPFRESLELGNGIYLNVGNSEIITPLIIEIEFSFDDKDKFSLVFSNRFKRRDYVNTLKDMVEESYSSSRSFDASKYIYNQSVQQASQVAKFMSDSLEAAKNTIIGAANKSVVIDGAGIHIGGDSNYQIRIVDNMIAMTDDGWQTAKLAIGRFASPEVGEYWGVNADVIGGKLLIGNNLILENETDDGVMQFKVDATGAWLNNANFVLQKDSGGKIMLDPRYGILAGTGSLFDTDGTTITPSFVEDGKIVLDDGLPKNANFYLSIKDGSAYFRGRISATSGLIGGFTIEEDYLHAGKNATYVALNGSGSNDNAAYAIWAGAEAPDSAPFSLQKNGDIYATTGTFKGDVYAATYKDKKGNLMMNDDYEFIADYLNLNGIDVGDGNFVVDTDGNVTVSGKIIMGAGSAISWDYVNSDPTIEAAAEKAESALSKATTAESTSSSAKSIADSAVTNLKLLADGQYTGGSFIVKNTIYSPTLVGDKITLSARVYNEVSKTYEAYEVGNMTLSKTNTYAFDLTSKLSLRMQSQGNTYLSGGSTMVNNISYTPFLQLLQESTINYPSITLGGGVLVLGALNIGTSHPNTAFGRNNGIFGQVYLMVS